MMRRGWIGGSVALFLAAACLQAGVSDITRASNDRSLSFVHPGTIAEVLVAEGQIVKQGQLLIRQDDKAEQEQLAQLQAEAETDIRIRAAQAKLDDLRVTLARWEEAAKSQAATPLELRQAQVGAVMSALELELARFDHTQAVHKYQEMKAQLERMHLLSPIEGRVEVINVREGETVVDAAKTVMRVVSVDPLWIDVRVPVPQAAALESGQKAIVTYGEPYNAIETGAIIHITAVVDAGSNTRRVRVQLANPQMRPCGLHVTVDFPSVPTSQPSAATKPVNP